MWFLGFTVICPLYACNGFGEWRTCEVFASYIAFYNSATLGKPAYLSMPKFLANCHYNEEEIQPALQKKI
jgi:hypothetical protein